MITFGIKDIIDIVLVALLLYYIYRLMKESSSVIVPSKAEYGLLLEMLQKHGAAQTSLEERRLFATRAFGVSSHYDTAIHNWFSQQ